MDAEIEKLKRQVFELNSKLHDNEYQNNTRELTAAGWPPALIKSTYDPFDYALSLKDGTIIFFEYATAFGHNHEWAVLRFQNMHSGSRVYEASFNRTHQIGGNDRGLEVRVSEILWAADAPYGS
jgi:hypothetical protein